MLAVGEVERLCLPAVGDGDLSAESSPGVFFLVRRFASTAFSESRRSFRVALALRFPTLLLVDIHRELLLKYSGVDALSPAAAPKRSCRLLM